MDFAHTHNLIDELGGVNVEIPEEITTSGVTFHPGPNHLNGTTALSYVRQPGVPGGEEGRVLRQQSLTRAIVGKIGARHLLGKPRTYHRVLNAFTEALSGDSNFTNTELRSLALRMHSLTGRRGTYVTAPARTVTTPSGNHVVVLARPETTQLWSAIRNDSVAAFAKKHPGTVTPAAPH